MNALEGLAIIFTVAPLAYAAGYLSGLERDAFWAERRDPPTGPTLVLTPDGQWNDRPDPLFRWACCAIVPIWGGYSPLDEDRAFAREQLARWWRMRGPGDVVPALEKLFSQPPNAWTRVRVIVVASTAQAAGYVGAPYAWQTIERAARELQGRYRSFDELADDYLAARERWARGEFGPDAAEFMREASERVQFARANNWFGVRYAA